MCVASPWSVKMTKWSPARAAAAAMSSTEPLPSDRVECTWYAPHTSRPSFALLANVSARGGSVNTT